MGAKIISELKQASSMSVRLLMKSSVSGLSLVRHPGRVPNIIDTIPDKIHSAFINHEYEAIQYDTEEYGPSNAHL